MKVKALYSLLTVGSQLEDDVRKVRTIATVNFFSAITISSIIIIAPLIYFLISTNEWILIGAILEALGLAWVIWLNFIRKNELATIAFFALQNGAVLYFGLILEKTAGVHIMSIFLFGLGLLLFRKNSAKILAGLTSLLVLFILVSNYSYQFVVPVIQSTTDEDSRPMLNYIIYPVIMINIGFLFLMHEYNYTEFLQREKQLGDELRIKSLELERLSNLKTAILRENSHEIRGPMNVAFLIIQALKLDCRKNTGAHFSAAAMQHMFSALYIVRAIINNVLQLSKIETGKVDEVYKENIYVPDWITEIKDIYQYWADSKDVKIKLDVAPHMPEYIIGDKLKITQIIINILGNAIKFTRSSSTICMLVRPSVNDTYSIMIKDEGDGISTDQINRIFELFVSSGKEEGVGIGLFLSKKLAEIMKGSITVDSSPGYGTTFTITFPLEIGSATTADAEEEEIDYSGMKALLIDDDKISHIYMKRILTKIGFVTSHAYSGNEGVRMALTEKPHIIFSDYNLPDINGSEVVRQLKTNNFTVTIPIILVTGNQIDDLLRRSGEEVAEILETGVYESLTKPIFVPQLKLALRKLFPQPC